jgi:hypothetical protein
MGVCGGVLLLIGMLLELTAVTGVREPFGTVAAAGHVVLAFGGLCVLAGLGAVVAGAILVSNARHRAPQTLAATVSRAARLAPAHPAPAKTAPAAPADAPLPPDAPLPALPTDAKPASAAASVRLANAMAGLANALPRVGPQNRVYVPVTILAVAFFAQLVEASIEAFRLRGSLVEQLARQEATIADANKVRNQLSTLISGTNALAAAGNANARAVLDELRRQGVKFDGLTPPP